MQSPSEVGMQSSGEVESVVGGLRSDTFIPRISNLILRDLSG
jgi:hypothetical protein